MKYALTGFKGKIIWDIDKPDGQPRRRIDTSRAKKELAFKAKTGLEEGLKKTIEWYKEQRVKGIIPAERATNAT